MTVFEKDIRLSSEEIMEAVEKISSIYINLMGKRAISETKIKITF